MPSTHPHTRRLALTLGAIALIDLLLIGLVVALLSPVLTGLATAVGLPPALAWVAAAAALFAGFLALQMRTARATTLASVEATPVAEGADPDLRARIERLAQQADTTPPALGVVDSDVPNCFSVGGSDPMIVVSEGLLHSLEDDELDAVLGHELAHVLNRDATVLTLATFLPTLASDEPVAGMPGWARSHAIGAAILLLVVGALGSGAATDPLTLLVVTGVGLVLGGVLLGALATPVVYLAYRLAHDREFVADRAGARIAGDPAALACALEKLDDSVESAPTTDLRSTGDLVAELCFLPNGFVRDGDGEPDTADGLTVKLRSHPPTEERIARLRDLAAEE